MKMNRLFTLLLAGAAGALSLLPASGLAGAPAGSQARAQSPWQTMGRTQLAHYVAWRALGSAPVKPLVNFTALANAGLTGAGITIELDTGGLVGLQTAYDKGLLDPGEITIYNPDDTDENSAAPRHAVRAAEVMHMIAPKADIYICNENECSSKTAQPQGEVVAFDLLATSGSFAYGDSAADQLNKPPVAYRVHAYPDTLFYVGGPDSYGGEFAQGGWIATQAKVGGSTQTVWDVGAATGGTSGAAITLSKGFFSGTLPATFLSLEVVAPNVAVMPKLAFEVFDANGASVPLTITGDTPTVPGCDCLNLGVVIPALDSTRLPLTVYLHLVSGQFGSNAKLKFSVGNGVYSPYVLSPQTTGGIVPFLGSPPPANAEVVTGACPSTSVAFIAAGAESHCTERGGQPEPAMMAAGPYLAYNVVNRVYQELHYPTIAGDVYLDILKDGVVADTFGGTSNADPELAAVAALLLQAGLTPSQIHATSHATAEYMAGQYSDHQWHPAQGYGVMAPLAILSQYVTLPAPAVSGAQALTLSEGEAQGFAGLCKAASDANVTSYAWNFGDGASATGADTRHAWKNAGTYTVSFNCTETIGGGQFDGKSFAATKPATIAVTVNPASSNPPPPTPPPKKNPPSSGGGGGALGSLALGALSALLGLVLAIRRKRLWG
jgi:hypothetical protein